MEQKTFLNIAYLTKVNLASLNGSEGTGGNITLIKKVKSYDDKEYVYVSGQALRRYLKNALQNLGCKIAKIDKEGEPIVEKNGKVINLKKFKSNKSITDEIKKEVYSYTDLDLFGFMFPIAGGQTFRRWSPIKVAPLLSSLPFKGEFDYLTRKAEDISENRIAQIEMDTFNFMRGNIMVDVDEVGTDINEYTYEKKEMLGSKEKRDRINILIDAIKTFTGGAKQARHLEDIAPKFVIGIKQKTGNPFLLNVLKVDNKGNILIDLVLDEIKNFSEIIDNENGRKAIYFGLTKGIFPNEDEVKKEIEKNGYNLLSVNEALDSLKMKIKQ